jgi:hypothetical protein
MKTRTLLLLALACGVAIMLAGAVFLFQLATQDELAAPIPIGETTRVGDMDVAVIEAAESGGVLRVTIEIGGTDDDDPADEFRLIAAARPIPLGSSTCLASDGAGQSCDLLFEVGDVDGVSRVLFYERGDDQARWVLA